MRIESQGPRCTRKRIHRIFYHQLEQTTSRVYSLTLPELPNTEGLRLTALALSDVLHELRDERLLAPYQHGSGQIKARSPRYA